jgi:hypothetical protein
MAGKRSFLLRLPPELWEEIKRWADEELRSVNAQIEYLLREAVRRRRRRLLDDEEPPPSKK